MLSWCWDFQRFRGAETALAELFPESTTGRARSRTRASPRMLRRGFTPWSGAPDVCPGVEAGEEGSARALPFPPGWALYSLTLCFSVPRLCTKFLGEWEARVKVTESTGIKSSEPREQARLPPGAPPVPEPCRFVSLGLGIGVRSRERAAPAAMPGREEPRRLHGVRRPAPGRAPLRRRGELPALRRAPVRAALCGAKGQRQSVDAL